MRIGFGLERANSMASAIDGVMEYWSAGAALESVCASSSGESARSLRILGSKTKAGDRRERFANAGNVFVAQDRENDRRALIAELFPPGFRENSCARRIMRAIDDGAFVPALKPCGPIDTRQTSRDCSFLNFDAAKSQSGDRKRRILFLVRSRQGEGSRRVGLADDLKGRFALGRARADHFLRGGFLRGRDNGNVRFDNASFLSGDFFQSASQPGLVIVTDRRDHRDDWLNGIGGIKPAAEAGLERDHFATAFLEMDKRQGGRDFKKSRMRLPGADQFPDQRETVRDVFFGDHFATDLNALAIREKVRGREQAGAIALRAASSIDHRTNGSFAVCPGDVNDAPSFPGNIQLAEQALHVLQPELYAEALRAVKPAKRLSIVGRESRHSSESVRETGASHSHCVVEK